MKTKTAQRLKTLNEQILFLKQGCLERESLGSQLCNNKWNCCECKLKIKAEEREIKGILFEKNELKEKRFFLYGENKLHCKCSFCKWTDNLIQEIESVEKQ